MFLKVPRGVIGGLPSSVRVFLIMEVLGMKKMLCVVALLIISASLLLEAPAAAQAQVQEIRIGDSKGDWGSPNAYRHYPRGPGYIRMSWVFDTLVWKDREGYMPALADSWSYDPAKMAFTFNLNPKAKWHDGQPVTAQDVAFTIEYFKKYPYSWISVDDIEPNRSPGAP